MSRMRSVWMRSRIVGWVERSETHQWLPRGDGFCGVYHRARIRATRWLYPSYIRSLRLSHRWLHQQRRYAAGTAAHGHHPRSRLAAGAAFRDIDAASCEPRPGRVDIGDAPADAAKPVLRCVHLLVARLGRAVRHLDDEIAAAEEHQPAPVRMRPGERH